MRSIKDTEASFEGHRVQEVLQKVRKLNIGMPKKGVYATPLVGDTLEKAGLCKTIFDVKTRMMSSTHLVDRDGRPSPAKKHVWWPGERKRQVRACVSLS